MPSGPPRTATAFDIEPVSSALRTRPAALLLDFGGVVFETRKRPEGLRDAAALMHTELRRAGHTIDVDSLHASMAAGLTALRHWKHAMSRTREPRELTHRALWQDFLLADQPEPVRATAAGDATRLMAAINPLLNDHQVRPGVPELLSTAQALAIPVGIVSNAHSGLAHRTLLREFGLAELVAVQLYSDEAGIRKPHPDMIHRAAAALGATPAQCWYVGDTQDRDVQSGRRAGVGAVVLTRSKHTDSPPFAVLDRPDAIFDTPEGLLPLLTAAGEHPTAPSISPPRPATPVRPGMPKALLLDQGGVLTHSEKTPRAVTDFATDIAARLRTAGHAVPDELMADALEHGRLAYQAAKRTEQADHRCPEVTPAQFWGEFVGAHLPGTARDWLLAEASELTFGYAQAKSSFRLRDGVTELLTWCRDARLPVAIVSNTICGRSGRARLRDAGVLDLIGAFAYSDEVGYRKPDPTLVFAATRALGLAPAECWFVGDKPWRDATSARAAGVGTAVIVRGGSPTDDELADGLADDQPDLLLDSITEVLQALRTAHETP